LVEARSSGKGFGVIVCASLECFPELPKDEVPATLVELQFSAVEMPIHENDGWMRPADILANPEGAVDRCRDIHRLNIVALSLDQGIADHGQSIADDPAGEELYYEQFSACAKLAKSLQVVPLIVPAAQLGTPFNEEIERLRRLVKIASLEGALVAMKTQIGCMTEDPDTAVVLCDNVKGLGLALDPSHYLTGPWQGRDISKVMPYVYHVSLRDSTKNDLQVRVGKGEVDYGRLISDLEKVGYNRALSVHMTPIEGFEHRAEMRKMRLLLESLL
jgi:sugar phosphate isomerase/epimerase